MHGQTFTCEQLFEGHVLGSGPMEGKEELHQMMKRTVLFLEAKLRETFPPLGMKYKRSIHLINQAKKVNYFSCSSFLITTLELWTVRLEIDMKNNPTESLFDPGPFGNWFLLLS